MKLCCVDSFCCWWWCWCWWNPRRILAELWQWFVAFMTVSKISTNMRFLNALSQYSGNGMLKHEPKLTIHISISYFYRKLYNDTRMPRFTLYVKSLSKPTEQLQSSILSVCKSMIWTRADSWSKPRQTCYCLTNGSMAGDLLRTRLIYLALCLIIGPSSNPNFSI